MTRKIEVDWGLCESNGVCMGINADIFELGGEAVRQCPRQAIAITGE
jgi:ferredoxin